MTVLFVGTGPDPTGPVAGHEVSVERASNVEEALERIEHGGVDCVVSDHGSPEVDGLALAERLRERRLGVPLVLWPSGGSESLASEAVAAGVSGYVASGDGPGRPPAAVEGAVERARERSEHVDARGTVRDRERALETLHGVAATIGEAGTVEAACEATVEAASEVLDLETCAVFVAEGEWLVPKAVSPGTPDDGTRRMRTDHGLAGRTYLTGESHLVDDFADEPSAAPADERYRSGVSVPVGETAVFQAVAAESGAFDDTDVEMAELLVAHTARALDRIRYEEELERQNERLEEFAGVVTHDLRNPLNVAQGRLEMAREEVESVHLEPVDRALSRMAAIIDDTLTLARQGRAAVDLESVDLATFAGRCWRLVGTGDARLDVRDSSVFRADPDRLCSLFENLFRNCVEHGAGDSNGGPTVTVGTVGREGFYVADDGPGIPAPERERVFEAGYTTSAEGTGFGLAIVGAVAEAHGWEVSATESETGGTRVEVTGVEPVD